MTVENDDQSHPKSPKPEEAHPIPTSANEASDPMPPLPPVPVPGSNPPGMESPLDFIRRRTREIRAAEKRKKERINGSVIHAGN